MDEAQPIEDWIITMLRIYVITGLAALLVVAVGYLYHSSVVGRLETQLATRTEERDAAWEDVRRARANTAVLEHAVNRARAQIEAAYEHGRQAEEATKAEVQRVRVENKTLLSRVNLLLTSTRPTGMDACANAARLIDEEIAALSVRPPVGVR